MSDSKSTYGEPVEEPRAVDDVVGSAHEGIADAEAARRDAVVAEEPVRTTPAAEKSRVVSEPMVDEDPEFNSAMYEAHADDAGTRTTDAPAKQVVTPAETVPADRAPEAPRSGSLLDREVPVWMPPADLGLIRPRGTQALAGEKVAALEPPGATSDGAARAARSGSPHTVTARPQPG